MTFKIEILNTTKERQFKLIRLSLCSLFFIFYALNIFAQDSISLPKDLTEEKELKFQKYFFKALSEKSINSFQKAIENLESCNQILPNDVSVFFEFSKNYYRLNNAQLAKEYIDRALAKDPNNIWMLKHLVAILQKQNNYERAIKTQEKIIKIKPKDAKAQESLSRLFLRNNQPQKALELLQILDKKNGLPNYLQRVKVSLEKRNSGFKKRKKTIKLGSLIEEFEKEKTYVSLEKLLKTNKSDAVLLKYSQEGIKLFPAQPYVYLVNGKVLNEQKSYKKALTVLKNGVDFVIEEIMEKEFYKEIAKSFKGLGNNKEETKYLKKLK